MALAIQLNCCGIQDTGQFFMHCINTEKSSKEFLMVRTLFLIPLGDLVF